MDISYELLNDVERVLIVSFIVTTVLVSIFFLRKCRRVSEILSKPVYCSRVFLSLGCILLAFFPYIVLARRFFYNADEFFKVTTLTSKLFLFDYFPFVFGSGLLLQGMSLMSSSATYSGWSRCHVGPQIRSMMIAIFPWFLGLALMFFLANLGENEYDSDKDCFGTTRSSVFMIVKIFCTIFPAVAALLCSVVLMKRSSSRSPNERPKDTTTDAGSSSPLVMASAPAAPPQQPIPMQQRVVPTASPFHPMQNYAEKYPQLEPPQSPPSYSPQPQFSPTQSPPEYAELYPQLPRQPPQAHQPQQYPPQVHSQQYLQMYSQHYHHQQPEHHVYATPSMGPHIQAPAPAPAAPAALSSPQAPPLTPTPIIPSDDEPDLAQKARVTLLLSAFLFAISVLPVSVFWLSFSCGCLHDWERDDMILMHSSVFWLLFLYPLVVPVVWLRDIIG